MKQQFSCHGRRVSSSHPTSMAGDPFKLQYVLTSSHPNHGEGSPQHTRSTALLTTYPSSAVGCYSFSFFPETRSPPTSNVLVEPVPTHYF